MTKYWKTQEGTLTLGGGGTVRIGSSSYFISQNKPMYSYFSLLTNQQESIDYGNLIVEITEREYEKHILDQHDEDLELINWASLYVSHLSRYMTKKIIDALIFKTTPQNTLIEYTSILGAVQFFQSCIAHDNLEELTKNHEGLPVHAGQITLIAQCIKMYRDESTYPLVIQEPWFEESYYLAKYKANTELKAVYNQIDAELARLG